MTKNKIFITDSHHTFKSALLRSLLLLCLLPAPAKAQLFGGTMKARPSIPPTITLAQDMHHFVASVYDENYLPYNGPGAVADTLPVNADGTPETLIINMQGTITTSLLYFYIPVTATGDGILPSYSTTINVPRELTEDDTSRDLKFSWETQTYDAATTYIRATIVAVDGPLNVKKLDINGGLGSNYYGIDLGQFVYPYDCFGAKTTYSLHAIPGIPDKKFGKYDLSNTTTYEHNFLYLPMNAVDRTVWLSTNLGAAYNDVNNAVFNVNKRSVSWSDKSAFGSLFQWGRAADGHELVTWNSSGVPTPKYATTTVRADTPTSSKFISSTVDWRATSNSSLWANEASDNNPCPVGYRVPTETEFRSVMTKQKVTDYMTLGGPTGLCMPTTSRRSATGTFELGAYWGVFQWCADTNGTLSKQYQMRWTTITYNDKTRTEGCPVRCIKN